MSPPVSTTQRRTSLRVRLGILLALPFPLLNLDSPSSFSIMAHVLTNMMCPAEPAANYGCGDHWAARSHRQLLPLFNTAIALTLTHILLPYLAHTLHSPNV